MMRIMIKKKMLGQPSKKCLLQWYYGSLLNVDKSFNFIVTWTRAFASPSRRLDGLWKPAKV